MKVRRVSSSEGQVLSPSQGQGQGQVSFELLDDSGQPLPEVSWFMHFLSARGCSPNTLAAYAYDLLHFAQFFVGRGLDFGSFGPAESILFLEYLRSVSNARSTHRYSLVLCTGGNAETAGVAATRGSGRSSSTRLAPATINRAIAAVSSFYDYLIVSAWLQTRQNPIAKQYDPALARVADDISGSPPYPQYPQYQGTRPARQSSWQLRDVSGVHDQAGHDSWGWRKPIRRTLTVKTAQYLPRPMSDGQVEQLLLSFSRWRDKAMLLLMLQGGLRPGEVLSLHLDDIEYGHRRVIVRYHTDHPKGVRTKSRRERVVDLHEPEALHAVATYVMQERPLDFQSPYVFLVGGKGRRRGEPLGYAALVKMFQRHCERLNIREYWTTPHALRHTHATKMWEQGMRELTLQKRLGHASLDSTRRYTRVSDKTVVAEYRHALGLGNLPSQEVAPLMEISQVFIHQEQGQERQHGLDGIKETSGVGDEVTSSTGKVVGERRVRRERRNQQ